MWSMQTMASPRLNVEGRIQSLQCTRHCVVTNLSCHRVWLHPSYSVQVAWVNYGFQSTLELHKMYSAGPVGVSEVLGAFLQIPGTVL